MPGCCLEEQGTEDSLAAFQVLVEGVNPKNGTEAMGRTSHNKLCFFPGNGTALKGKIVKVHVNEIRAYTLSGYAVAGI